MNHTLAIVRYSVLLVLIGFGISLGQDVNKKGSILDNLHPSLAEASAPLGIRLLPGYKHEAAVDFEGNKVGRIWEENGIKITYGIGMSQGHAVDLSMRNRYQWHKEQIVQGRKVKLALNKENILIITIPLNESSSWQAANFYGEVKKPEDTVDMILMILTFKL